jgi:hypothetical protein
MAARYRLTERAFIKPDDHLEASLHEAGAEFDYSGTPSRNFIALNAEGAAALSLLEPLSRGMTRSVLPRLGDPAP